MRITIKSSCAQAEIDTLGAQLMSLKGADGLEYLWQGDPTYWTGRAPVLFPIVGALRNQTTLIDGKEYHMRRHGFAKQSEFAVAEQTENAVTFSLRANEETKKQYPFDFELRVSFRLDGATLLNEFAVLNHGDTIMPFAVGGHPAFNCPLVQGEDFTDYVVEFEQPEVADCPAINMETGVIEVENRTRVLNGGKQIALQHSLFYKDALVFDNLKSRSVKLYSQKSGRGVKMDFAGFDYFGVWSAVNDAPYVCLEPWTGCATCTDEDDVLANKRGMCMLQVGNERRSAFSVTLL